MLKMALKRRLNGIGRICNICYIYISEQRDSQAYTYICYVTDGAVALLTSKNQDKRRKIKVEEKKKNLFESLLNSVSH